MKDLNTCLDGRMWTAPIRGELLLLILQSASPNIATGQITPALVRLWQEVPVQSPTPNTLVRT